MNKYLAWVIVAIVVVGGSWLISAQQNSGSANTAASLTVGVLTPLTGDAAEYGTNSMRGIQLAVSEINKDGGINGRQVQILPEDSKCDPTAAVSAFTKAVQINGVRIILGTACSGVVQAIMPLAEKQGVLVLSSGASSPSLTGVSKYFSRDYPSDAYEAQAAAQTLYDQLKLTRAAVLFLNNDYGVALKDAFEKTYTSLGGNIVLDEAYTQGASDMRTQLTKISAADPQVLYLVAYPVDGGVAVKQARALGITSTIVGSSGIKAADFIKTGGAATEGTLIVTPATASSTKRSLFIADYQKAYGTQPGLLSDTAYDSVYLLKQAFASTSSIADVADNLQHITSYAGASGVISIGTDGDRKGSQYDLLVVKNGAFVPYTP